ncbi:hypothetical protein RQP46_005133 [Phenoliferia psychrophenolica]
MSSSHRMTVLPGLPAEPYSRQPWKTLYLLHRVLSTVALQPLWTLLHFSPFSPFPKSWSLKETLLVRSMSRLAYIISRCDLKLAQREHTILPDKSSLKETRAIWIPPAGDEWLKGVGKSDEVATVKIPGYVWGEGKDEAGDMAVGKSQSVMLFLHGGGLAVGSAHEKDITAVIPRQMLKRSNISHVLSVDYRKVQTAPFPAALLDCLSAWVYLTSTLGISPTRVFLAGDSAGGHLALALTRYLRDSEFDLPSALLLFSPWVDMSKDALPKLHRFKNVNADSDYLNTDALQPYISSRLLGTLPVSLLDGAYLSPAADTLPSTPELFAKFPPAFVTAGGKEVLLDQIREVVTRMKRGGVNVVFDEQPDAIHDYELMDWFQPAMRERIFAKAAAWINSRFEK